MQGEKSILKPIIILIVIAGLLYWGLAIFKAPDSSPENFNPEVSNGSKGGNEEMSDGMEDKMSDDGMSYDMEDVELVSDSNMSSSYGVYEEYSPEKLERAKNGRVVLFFHASWCPTCRNQENNILDHLDELPKDLSILKIDYDTATELKERYGVKIQHSFVQVDEDGNALSKWINGRTVEDVVKNLK